MYDYLNWNSDDMEFMKEMENMFSMKRFFDKIRTYLPCWIPMLGVCFVWKSSSKLFKKDIVYMLWAYYQAVMVGLLVYFLRNFVLM